jgi:hypothetical protein
MSVYGGPEIADSSLVVFLDAGNVKSYPGSGTAWTDISGNGNNGTLTNGPTYSANNGGYIVFDGVNDQVVATSNYLNGTAGAYNTVEFWMYWTGGWGGFPMEFSSYRLWMPADVSGFGFNNGNGDLYGFNASSLANAWKHIVAVFYNGNYTNTSKIYVNGTLQTLTQLKSPATSGTADSTLTIGGYRGGATSYPFPGNIASFKAYSRELSQAEVLQNYNATYARYLSQLMPNQISGLALWLDASDPATVYQDSAGTTLATTDSSPVGMWKDRSGNARHATQVSSTASRPTFKTNVQKNRAAIYFDGSGTWLSNTAYTYSGATTLFVVASNTYDNGYYFDGAGGTIQMGMVRYSATTLKLWNGLQMLSDPNFNLANPSITESIWNGAASYLGVNGQFSAVGSTNPVSLTGYTVGRTRNGSGAGVMQGNIFEVLLYEGVLTSNQRQQVESYLNAKWGIY